MITAPNGYFTQEEAKTVATPVFVITLGGSYVVPQRDLLDPGAPSMSQPGNFADLSSGNHTFILDNSSGKYSPGKSTFIWAGSTWWRQAVKVELGYERPGWQGVIDKVSIYEGLITNWVVKEPKDYTADAPSQGITVEVTSKDHVSLLLERQIGMPADDGTPNPVVFGTVFHDLVDLADKRLGWNPDKSATFEGGNLSEITTVETFQTGAVAASSAEKHTGNYAAKASASQPGDLARLIWDIGTTKANVRFTANMKFTQMPPAQSFSGDATFMALRAANGVDFLVLKTWNDNYVYVYDHYGGGQFHKTNWYLPSSLNKWVRVSILYKQVPGVGAYSAINILVDGNSVWEQGDGNNPNTVRYVWVGLAILYENLPWEVYLDDLELDYQSYPKAFYMPGYPYLGINNVWQDGALLPKEIPQYPTYSPYINQLRQRWVISASASLFPFDNFATYPSQGIVNCIHTEAPPSGILFGEFVHDAISHPVDQIANLLTIAGLGDRIDTANFAACKSAMTNDQVGSYQESATCAAAISDITGRMLYSLVERSGKLCLIPYTGSHLGVSVLTLNRQNCHSMEQDLDQENIKTGVTVKWGWYDKDNSLFYRHDNISLKALLGDQTQALDMSYGASVQSSDKTTAKAKADLLLKRTGGAIDSLQVSGDLSLARVELGDGCLVQCVFNDTDLIYEVVSKTVDLTNRTVDLTVNRYQGED